MTKFPSFLMNYVPGTAPADKTMLSPAYLWANSSIYSRFRSFAFLNIVKISIEQISLMWSMRKAFPLNTDGYMPAMLLPIAFGFVCGSGPIGLWAILSFVLLALVFLVSEVICQFWVTHGYNGHVLGRWGRLIAYNKTSAF